MAIIERPFPGHFIMADRCQFFRCTDIDGRWRVSTVGELVHEIEVQRIRARARGVPLDDMPKYDIVGADRLYETMVFPLGADLFDCDCGKPDCPTGAPKIRGWRCVDFSGYNTRADAEAGHAAMVAYWSQVDFNAAPPQGE